MNEKSQNSSFVENLKEKMRSKTAKIIVFVFFVLFSILCFSVAFQNGVEKSEAKRSQTEMNSGKMKTTVDDDF